MRQALRRFHAAVIALLAVVIVSSSECRALDPMATAPSQVAAAVYVQEWGQILWGLVTSQTATQPSVFGEPIFNDDGSVTQGFTAADGTEAILTFYPDGSARIDLFLPDGSLQTVLQSPPSFDGLSTTTIDWSVVSSDGLSVIYTSTIDDRGTPFDISDDSTELLGSSVLPGGITQTFHVLTAAGQTEVQSTQSDGSTFSLIVPLSLPDLALPDLSLETIGSYVAPDFTVDFALTPTSRNPFRWAAFLCDVDGGVAGTFYLNADFSGAGQLEQSSAAGQTLAGLVSWTPDGDIQAYDLSGQDIHMGPTGAALDFLDHRWETLAALMAPAPGAAATVVQPRRSRLAPRLQPPRPRSLGSLGACPPTVNGKSTSPAPVPEAVAPTRNGRSVSRR